MRKTCLVALLALLAVPGLAGEKADRIFVNGRVWTGDDAKPRAEALAVRGQTVLAVGTTEEIRKLAEKHTQVVDLKGRLLVPGFNDAHLHLMSGALAMEKADLVGAGNLAEIQRRVAAFASTHPEARWVLGRGWAFGDLPEGGPDRKMLDEAVPDRPVALTDRDGHSVWCNSRALVEAGITRITPNPPDGIVVRDASGEPTGLLKESAGDLVEKHVPLPGEAEKYRALRRAVDLLASYGITSVQNASFDLADLPVYLRLLGEGNLKLRVYSAPPLGKDHTPVELGRYQEIRNKYRTSNFRFGAVKVMLDGVVDARTAAMLEPYVGGGSGLLNWTPEALNAAVALYDREGFQVLIHAIGDRAIRVALDAFEQAARVNGPRQRRHRVEHIEVPHPADLPRFKALGVIASTQATFAEPDKTTLENFAVVLGPQRTALADSFKLFDDAGAVQAFGSDWPVFSCEVLRAIYFAVTRQTAEGTPPGGWEPQGRITTEAALRHYTRDAAYAQFEDSLKGTLAPGKAADLAVLSEDVLSAPPERLLKAKVLLTVMGGNDTYRAREF
jgi:hypothetical protein